MISNVLNFGAVADDATENSVAFQNAINAASAGGGGLVDVPAGTYRLANPITVKAGVTLRGEGWKPVQDYASATRTPGPGTWLHWSPASGIFLITLEGGARLQGLAIREDQPTPGPGWSPNTTYSWAIATGGGTLTGDIVVEDVLLFNVTYGFSQNDPVNSNGRLFLNRVWGQPLSTGIDFEFCSDVVRVTNVHFWPFWSVDANVTAWTLKNAIAIVSRRNDNPEFVNCFALNVTNNGVRVDGGGNELMLDNYRIENWNLSGVGFPAIELAPGNTAWLGFTRRYLGGGGAVVHGGAGAFALDA